MYHTLNHILHASLLNFADVCAILPKPIRIPHLIPSLTLGSYYFASTKLYQPNNNLHNIYIYSYMIMPKEFRY